MDGFRTRYVTLSCPGEAYFLYESWPMSDQTKMTCFIFVFNNSSLKFLTVKIVSAVPGSHVLYLQEVSDLHS